MIKRHYADLSKYIKSGRVLITFRPRQAGKITILENHLKKSGKKYKLDSGKNLRTQQLLASQDFTKILGYAEGYELIAIDETQLIPNIGMALKILVDKLPHLSIFVIGSSSFELSQNVGELLTGRKHTLLSILLHRWN